MKLTNKKPILFNHSKNFERVTKIHFYYLHYNNKFLAFTTKKELKNYLLEQWKQGLVLVGEVANLELDCVVSKSWYTLPVKSVVGDHFTITY